MAEERLERELDRLRAKLGQSGVTVDQAIDEWLRYIEFDRRRKRSTVKDYRGTANHALRPRLGKLPIEEVTTATIDAYREELVSGGRLSPRTINKHLALLHGVFKRAQRKWGLRSNPVAAAERQPEHDNYEFQVLESWDEVEALVRAAADEQDAALYLTAVGAGLRMGELRGLRLRDVDYLNALLWVRKNFVEGEVGTPKATRFAASRCRTRSPGCSHG